MTKLALRTGIIELTKHCEVKSNGLVIDEKCTSDEWIEIGNRLNKIEGAVQWWIGDWLLFGEKCDYAESCEETGYAYGSLRNMKMVASKYSLSSRDDKASWHHHLTALSLPDNLRFKALDYSVKNKMSAKDFVSYVKRLKREEYAKDEVKAPKDVQLFCDDFRNVDLKPESVDLIVTDPPYPKEYLNLWQGLGDYANKVLKPGGFLVTYSGQLYLNEIFPILNCHLEYYWTGCLQHSGGNQLVHARNVLCEWKPILIYCKAPMHKIDQAFSDIFKGGTREKELHDWQQSEVEVKRLIEIFSMPNQTVLDPFAGSGTNLLAAKRLNRNVIGIEIEELNMRIIKKRFKELKDEKSKR